ncbi:MAG: hypothetical protein FJ090_22790 [Deltaproteobacteria bacterium]|nr:hypothetical protein [Deltaproteobacteria bacterium]
MRLPDPNRLLADPGPQVRGPARRWLANELASALSARVGFRQIGPFTALLREHLLNAWNAGRSPTLDEVLRAVVEPQPSARYGAAVDALEMNTRLEIALRYLTATPEFSGRVPEGPKRVEFDRFVDRASRARAMVFPRPEMEGLIEDPHP